MPVDSGMDVLLLLLYAKGATNKVNEPIRGITRLEKLIYLLNQEGGFHKYISDYHFEPYDFGPFSNELWDDIETLKDGSLGLVETQEVPSFHFIEISDAEKAMEEEESELKEEVLDARGEKMMEIYRLTERGKIVAEQLFKELTPEEQRILEKTKREFNLISLFELIRYVYLKYPESTAYSKIRKDILGEAAGG
ncbi:MAG: hypothetical protein HXS54_15050 [Theionarchaea archaeon]|nr:hypothetical protein [Theionarchaea archaeon]